MMTELIAVINVSMTEFAARYNALNASNGTVRSPNGHLILDCVNYSFYPMIQNDGVGAPTRGSGFILVNIEPNDTPPLDESLN